MVTPENKACTCLLARAQLSPQHHIIREPVDDDTAFGQGVDLISHAPLLFSSVFHNRRTDRS